MRENAVNSILVKDGKGCPSVPRCLGIQVSNEGTTTWKWTRVCIIGMDHTFLVTNSVGSLYSKQTAS